MDRTDLEFLDSLLASSTSTGDFDQVGRVNLTKLSDVLGLADAVVRARTRETEPERRSWLGGR